MNREELIETIGNMTQWEYKYVRIALNHQVDIDARAEHLEEMLNDFGEEGWEIVHVTTWRLSKITEFYECTFKRPLCKPLAQKRCETCISWSHDENLSDDRRCLILWTSGSAPCGCRYWRTAIPPVQLMTPLEAEESRGRQPQIIQRVPGAKYILEVEQIYSEGTESITDKFEKWLSGDDPFLILDQAVHVHVVLLPVEETTITIDPVYVSPLLKETAKDEEVLE